jgi:hypothetical protein
MKTEENNINLRLDHEMIFSPVCNDEVRAVKSGTLKNAGDRICSSFESPNREQAHQKC